MIDMRHPLAVLARRLPWDRIEQTLAPKFAHQDRPAKQASGADLLGDYEVEFGGGVSNAGRPRLSIRLMASLVYLKNAFNLSDEELVARWSENLYWQYFIGLEYFEPRLPCDATRESGAFAAPSARRDWSSCSRPPSRPRSRSR